MNSTDLVLNIAVNMGRLSRWAQEGKKERIKQFITDTDWYIDQIDEVAVKLQFRPTLKAFKEKYNLMKQDIRLDRDWAEDALTWANVLTHRAKLA